MILKIAMQCFNDESRDICRHWNNRIKLTRCYRLFKAKVPMILGVDFMPLYFSSRTTTTTDISTEINGIGEQMLHMCDAE